MTVTVLVTDLQPSVTVAPGRRRRRVPGSRQVSGRPGPGLAGGSNTDNHVTVTVTVAAAPASDSARTRRLAAVGAPSLSRWQADSEAYWQLNLHDPGPSTWQPGRRPRAVLPA